MKTLKRQKLVPNRALSMMCLTPTVRHSHESNIVMSECRHEHVLVYLSCLTVRWRGWVMGRHQGVMLQLWNPVYQPWKKKWRHLVRRELILWTSTKEKRVSKVWSAAQLRWLSLAWIEWFQNSHGSLHNRPTMCLPLELNGLWSITSV